MVTSQFPTPAQVNRRVSDDRLSLALSSEAPSDQVRQILQALNAACISKSLLPISTARVICPYRDPTFWAALGGFNQFVPFFFPCK